MIVRCNTCRGTYSPVLTDGTAYFHACSPVPNPDLQPDPEKPRFDPREFADRLDHRDENLDDSPSPNRGKPKKPGKGRTILVP